MLSNVDLILHLLLAALLGSLIGFERERQNRAAGYAPSAMRFDAFVQSSSTAD